MMVLTAIDVYVLKKTPTGDGILNGQTYQPAVKMALVKIWQVLIVEIQLMMQLMMQLVDYKKMMVIILIKILKMILLMMLLMKILLMMIILIQPLVNKLQ